MITLLNTRPAHQADRLNQLLEAQGIECLSCPTLNIKLFENATPIESPSLFDKTIFISTNAIQGFLQQPKQVLDQIVASSRFYAIGRATRDYGLQQGLNIEMLSEQSFDSEHLLAHSVMQEVSGESILLVKGVAGRSLIEQTLSARGAKVVELEVYRREPACFCADSWSTLLAREYPVLLMTSVASWQALLKAHAAHYQIEHKLLDKTLFSDVSWQKPDYIVAMSQRIADEIKQAGWQGVIKVVETQSNEGIMEALMALQQTFPR